MFICMPKINFIIHFALEISQFKESCNLTGQQHIGPKIKNQNFARYEIGSEIPIHNIVCKGVPALPFWRHWSLDPACPLFKIFISPSLISIAPPFKVFQIVPPPSCRQPPSCSNPTHQPSLQIINGFKQISKEWFYQFTRYYLSKINF